MNKNKSPTMGRLSEATYQEREREKYAFFLYFSLHCKTKAEDIMQTSLTFIEYLHIFNENEL